MSIAVGDAVMKPRGLSSAKIVVAFAFGAAILLPDTSFAAEGFDVSLTPRFQYFMVNVNGFESFAGEQDSVERVEIPFPGLTIGIRPQAIKNTEFLISAFYGEDNGVLSDSGEASSDITRFDAEFLVRHVISDTAVNFYYGVRAILTDEDTTATGTIPASQSTTLEDSVDWYFGELGIGFSVPLTNSGIHLAFGGITGLLGYQKREVKNRASTLDPDQEGFAYAADLQVGYQQVFSEKVSGHIRYRALLLSNHNSGSGGDKLLIGHGPEVGLTFRF